MRVGGGEGAGVFLAALWLVGSVFALCVCIDSHRSERLDLSCFTMITCSDIGWPGRLNVGLCSVCGGDTQAGDFLC